MSNDLDLETATKKFTHAEDEARQLRDEYLRNPSQALIDTLQEAERRLVEATKKRDSILSERGL